MSQPAYRPVRSPLMSMGPSLDEARRRHRHARLITVASILLVVVVLVAVWLIGLVGREVMNPDATGKSGSGVAAAPVLPVGPPEPQRLGEAVMGRDEPGLRLQLPIRLDAVTGIGFGTRHGRDVVELEPAGEPANLSWGRRMLERFLSTDPPGDLTWYRLSDGAPSTVIVGAAPGTDSYAPIEGRVLAILPYRIDGKQYGEMVQLQPLGDVRTVLVLRGLDVDPELTVGQAVSEGTTRIGTVRDLEGAVEAPLAAFTHDSGSGLELYVTRTQTPGDFQLATG